jgi:hypothetical protein
VAFAKHVSVPIEGAAIERRGLIGIDKPFAGITPGKLAGDGDDAA